MKPNIETEHKCLLTKNDYQKLVTFYHNSYQEIHQLNNYFVDANDEIIRQKAVLRIRKITNVSTITFKITKDSQLYEYEVLSPNLENPQILKVLAQNNIYPPFKLIASLLTIRRLVKLPKGELCLDENHYNQQIDYEIEYEETVDHDGLAMLKDILAHHNIPYLNNPISKFKRVMSAND